MPDPTPTETAPMDPECGSDEPLPKMGPKDFKGLSDDETDKQNALKQAAAEALEDGDSEKALEKFTEAIVMGTDSALLYSRRAKTLLKLNRLLAAINDCDAALELNPDSARAYRIRGEAKLRKEDWQAAHLDLSTAQKLDFDDSGETEDLCFRAAEGAKKIQQQQLKDRLSKEREEAAAIMQENKKIYEENMRAREGELREQRMKEEADREKLKEEVKSRNRARAEEERQKREEEEAEENEVNASDDEGESGGEKSKKEEEKKAGEGPEEGTVPEVD